jgi:hypothetical protein
MKLAAVLAAFGLTLLLYNVPHLWRDDAASSDYGHGVFFGFIFVFAALWRLFRLRED